MRLIRNVLDARRGQPEVLQAPPLYRTSVWPLPARIEGLLTSGRCSDLVFEVNGEETGDADESFRAHKVILSAGSEYFRGMLDFESHTLHAGAETGGPKVVPVRHVSPGIFRLLLQFIYSQQLPATTPVGPLCDLLLLADMYSMPELKLYIAQLIKDHQMLTVDSVLYAYNAAELAQCALLQGACLDYMVAHQAQVSAHARATNAEVDVGQLVAARKAVVAPLNKSLPWDILCLNYL